MALPKIFSPVEPKSPNQEKCFNAIKKNIITFILGNPGSGKSIISLSAGLELLFDRKSDIKKIVISRPLVRTNIGEMEVGILPGELDTKISPYFGGVNDNILELLSKGEIQKLITDNKLEFTALSLCRGRSLKNTYFMIDEGQNLNRAALKMILTRIHDNSKLVINGDIDQCDLHGDQKGDLMEVIKKLNGLKGVDFVELYDPIDIQRSSLITEILKRLK